MLVAFIPAGLILAYAVQSTLRFWRAPNPYRFSIWLVGLLMMGGILILLYVPMLANLLPVDISTNVRLLAHQSFNLCLMLSGYYVNVYCTTIMHGWQSPAARQSQRRYLGLLLITISIMVIFFLRAVAAGEQETATWFAKDPQQNGDLIIVSLACLVYMCVIYLRIASFNRRFARITPVPSFKTGNYCFLVVNFLGLLNSLLAFISLWIPAASPVASYLSLAVSLNIGVLLIVFYLGARLVENPGIRLRRFGERAWSIMTVTRLYPLWHTLTSTIPEVIPPVTMPWLATILQNRVDLLRDARIVEILDAMHRLDLTLGSQTSQRAWIVNIQEVVNQADAASTPPNHRVMEVERLAQHDAAQLVIALANYVPTQRGPQRATSKMAPIATLLHPPSFSAQEVHYLELVAAAFRRMHTAATLDPALVASRFDIA